MKFTILLLAACLAVSTATVHQNVRIKAVTTYVCGTGCTDVSTNPTTPQRVYKGYTFPFTFTDNDDTNVKRIINNDRFLWVSGKTDCSSLADTDGSAITARAGTQKFTAAGAYQLCYKQGDKPWQYYGTTQSLQVTDLTKLDDGVGWYTKTERTVSVSHVNLRDGDIVVWDSTKACKDFAIGNSIGVTWTAKEQANVLATSKVVVGTQTLVDAGLLKFKKLNVCYRHKFHTSQTAALSADLGTAGTVDTGLKQWIEDINPKRSLAFVFPRWQMATASGATDGTSLKSTFTINGMKWRIGGRLVRAGDAISFAKLATASGTTVGCAQNHAAGAYTALTDWNGVPGRTKGLAITKDADTVTAVVGLRSLMVSVKETAGNSKLDPQLTTVKTSYEMETCYMPEGINTIANNMNTGADNIAAMAFSTSGMIKIDASKGASLQPNYANPNEPTTGTVVKGITLVFQDASNSCQGIKTKYAATVIAGADDHVGFGSAQMSGINVMNLVGGDNVLFALGCPVVDLSGTNGYYAFVAATGATVSTRSAEAALGLTYSIYWPAFNINLPAATVKTLQDASIGIQGYLGAAPAGGDVGMGANLRAVTTVAGEGAGHALGAGVFTSVGINDGVESLWFSYNGMADNQAAAKRWSTRQAFALWIVGGTVSSNVDCYENRVQFIGTNAGTTNPISGWIDAHATKDNRMVRNNAIGMAAPTATGVYTPVYDNAITYQDNSASDAAIVATPAAVAIGHIKIPTTVPAGEYTWCYSHGLDGAAQKSSFKFKVYDAMYTFPKRYPAHQTSGSDFAAGLSISGGDAALKYQFTSSECPSDVATNSITVSVITAALLSCTGCAKDTIVAGAALSDKATAADNLKYYTPFKTAGAQKVCISAAPTAAIIYGHGNKLGMNSLNVLAKAAVATAAIAPKAFVKGRAAQVSIDDDFMAGDVITFRKTDCTTAGDIQLSVSAVDTHKTSKRAGNFSATFTTAAVVSTSKICLERKGAGESVALAITSGTYRVAEVTALTKTPVAGDTEARTYFTSADFDMYWSGKEVLLGAANTGDALMFFSDNSKVAAAQALVTATDGNAVGRVLTTATALAATSVVTGDERKTLLMSKNSGNTGAMTYPDGAVQLYFAVADGDDLVGTAYSTWVATGFKTRKVAVSGIFPSEIVKGVTSTFYLSSATKGLKSSDTAFAGPNCATADIVGDSTTAKKVVKPITLGGTVETEATSGLTWNSDSALTVAFKIPDNTWAEASYKVCYCASTACAHDTNANFKAKLWTDAGVTLNARDLLADATTSASYTNPTKALGSTDFYIRANNKTTFPLTAGNVFTVQTGFKFAVIANGKTCGATSAAAADAVADTTVTAITLTAYQKATWDITSTAAQTANNVPHKLCFQFSGGAFRDAGSIYVSNAGTTITPTYMLASTGYTATQKFTLTGSGFTAKDATCFSTTGTCPTTCNTAVTPATGTTPTTATFDVTTANAETYRGQTVTVCYRAGGVDFGANTQYSLAHVISTIDFVDFDVKPQTVIKTATGKKRNAYLCNTKLYKATDKIAFTTATACTAVTVSAAANATYSFDTAGANNLCFKRGADAAVLKKNTANAGQIITASAGNAVADFVSSNTATYYLVSDVVDTIAMSGHIQAGDNLRIIAKSKVCDSHATADIMYTSPFTGACALSTAWTVKPSADDLPLCIKVTDGVTITATTNTEKYIALTTAAIVKVATVLSFTPTTLLGATWEKVTFTGNHIDTDDFASFVATYYTDCAKAWVYEQALTSNKDAYFKLPAGTYALCFLHRKAGAFNAARPGYKYHTSALLHPLTVKSIKAVAPKYTSGGKSGDYMLMINNPWSTKSATMLTTKDRVVFTTGTCDLTTNTGAKNITIDTSVTPNMYSVKAVSLAANTDGTLKTYKLCVDFENSLSYNPTGGATGFAATHDTKLTVTSFGRPTIAGVSPGKVVKNTTNTIAFWGGYLGADKVHFLANNTCDNSSITALGESVALASAASVTLHSTELKNKNWMTTGRYEICYQFAVTQPFQAESGKNPAKSADVGAYLNVVNVDSIAPTNSQQATAIAATDATGTIEITFTGFFGASAADWAAFVPATEKDCSTVTPWSTGRRAVTAVDTKNGKAKFNMTDAAAGGEWKLCYKFSGMTTWTWYGMHIFSSRIVNSISPTSALRKGATAGSTEITLVGSGIRGADEVFFIFANSTTKTDAACSDAVTAKTQKNIQNVTATKTFTPALDGINGGVTNYWICYKYGGQTTYDLEMVTLIVEDQKLNSYYITGKKAATDALVVKDPSLPSMFTIEGTGVTSADTARFVPTANATDANCATGVADVVGTSEYKVDNKKNVMTIVVGVNEFVENTKYTLCYKFGSLGYTAIKTDNKAKALEVDVKVAKKVDGAYPLRFAAVDATSTVTIVGSGISAKDSGVWVQAASACTGTPTGAAAPTAPAADGKSATFKADTLKAGANWLCYKSDGGAYATVAKAFVGSCNATTCATGTIFCGSTCECYAPTAFASACKDPAYACAKSGQSFCAGSGVCRRSISECPKIAAPCPAAWPTKCPGQECAKDTTMCVLPGACPAATHIRCADGACAKATDGCNFRGAAIKAPSCGTTQKTCPSGYCADTCTEYNGCAYATAFRGADCRCYDTAANAAAASATCADGKAAGSNPAACKCDSLAQTVVAAMVTKQTAQVRRFVVRASAASTLSLYSNADASVLASVELPADALKETCTLGYGPVPNSIIYNFEGKSADSKIYSAAAGVQIMNSAGAACGLNSEPTVTFKALTIPASVTDTTKVECKNLAGAATATANHDATAKVYRCKISGSGAFALGKGVAQPKPTPTTGGTVNGTGSPGATPTGGASASTLSVSMLVAVIVAFIGAALF